MTLPHWTLCVHHDGSEAYVSNPFPKFGDTITLSLRVPTHAPIIGAYCRILFDGEFHHETMSLASTDGEFNLWTLDVPITQPRTEYSFKILTSDGSYYYNAMGASRADSPVFYDFLVLADYQAPHWVRDAVFYQIFPDRFHNGDPSNDVGDNEWMREGVGTRKLAWGSEPIPWVKGRSVDFFGGDIQGITQKLDFMQSFGINALYLTPVWLAASNHHYDASSFDIVDPHLGGDEALAELRRELDKRGMKLVLDITPNHVGVTHHWFEEAKKDRHSPSAEYFVYDESKGFFETWLGVASLIKLNYTSQKLRDVMYRQEDSAIRRWLKEPYRIDGWRLDVANMTGNLRMNQLDHDVWADMRPYVKNDMPDNYLLGEFFQDGTPHTQGQELDAAMNYQGFNTPTRRWLGGMDLGVADGHAWGDTMLLSTDALGLQYRRFMAAVPYVIALQQFNQLDSHDIDRILSVVKGDVALVKLGLAMLMSFVGVPCIYYGTEIGMEGGKDPDNRRCMPWDDSRWNKDLLAYTQKLTHIRQNSSALKHGGYQQLWAEGDCIAFLRESKTQKVVFVGYRGVSSSGEIRMPITPAGIASSAHFTDLLGGQAHQAENGVITLNALQHGQALLLEVQ
jgi:alpha-glucosidase